MFPKDAGESAISFTYVLYLPSAFSIVEYHNYEDAQRSIREMSESLLLGRPIFIREVSYYPPLP